MRDQSCNYASETEQRQCNILADILKNKLNHKDYNKHHVLVLGIPRGGVTIADIVAKKLSADFDIIIGKKLLAPKHEENAIGAIMEDDTKYLDQKILDKLKISEEYIQNQTSLTKKEIRRRAAIYSGKMGRNYEIKDKTVILIDDGAETGATIIAVCQIYKKQKTGSFNNWSSCCLSTYIKYIEG